MPLSYTIDADQGYAAVLGDGVVTLDEAIRTIRAVAAELAQHQCGSLVDLRKMDFYPTVAELKEVAFEYIRLRAAFRCGIAFIVSNDRHYALGRLLASMVDSAGLRVGVFHDSDEAMAWLRNLIDVHLND